MPISKAYPARLGARVVISGRSEEKLASTAAGMGTHGLAAEHRVANIRERDQVDSLYAWIGERFGRLDLVVMPDGPGFKVHGTFNMMQAAAQAWSAAGVGGSIVNVVVVPRGLHGVAHTVAARAGVIAFSEAVAVAWASLGIRVNCAALSETLKED